MSGSESETDQGLSEKIHDCLIDSEFDHDAKRFAPEGSLDGVITKESILEELKRKQPAKTELDALANYLFTDARKTFAIAIHAEISNLYLAMKCLKDSHFTDKTDLPIARRTSVQGHALSTLSKKVWRDPQIDKFYEQQWKFLAPVFSVATERQTDYTLQPSCILPFVKRHHSDSDKGSFGQVYKYEIHERHLIDPKKPGEAWKGYVAVKEILPRAEQDRQKVIQGWGREARILQKMNSLQQEHIVQFLTAFHRGSEGTDKFYLMFEWADGVNLRNLWKTHNRPSLTPGLVRSAVKQIEGLASALCKAHYPGTMGTNFRHGDLKPENIVWFKGNGDKDDVGTLKIADWGLAQEHNVLTEMRSMRTTTPYGTRRYEPPEEETGQGITVQRLNVPEQSASGRAEKKRSRLYDVWAMGCVALEFIIWLMYGPEELERFNNSSLEAHPYQHFPPFYQTARNNGKLSARIHDVAVKWMDHLAKDPACEVGATALGNLLEIVRTNLLVVQLPRRLGKDLRGSTANLSTANVLARSTQPQAGRVASAFQQPAALADDLPSTTDTPGIVISNTGADKASLAPEPTQASQPLPTPLLPKLLSTAEGPERATAILFENRMKEMSSEYEEEHYWLPVQPGLPPSTGSPKSPEFVIRGSQQYQTTDTSTIPEPSAPKEQSPVTLPHGLGLTAPEPTRIDYGHRNLNTGWELLTDNEFATKLHATFKAFPAPLAQPRVEVSSNLCSDCREFCDSLWEPSFSKLYETSHLSARSHDCDLCGLFWRTCVRHDAIKFPTVLFERAGSSLGMTGLRGQVLSLCRSPDLKTGIDADIPIGFANLPEGDNEIHFEIMRQWLIHCETDRNHATCRQVPPQSFSSTRSTRKELPTRVIDVGVRGDPIVRLLATGPDNTGEWVALSHQWGPGPHFSTTVHNLDKHLQGIPFDTLPATFRDAATVTRALGKRYLWIDSLCVVQGPGGDFGKEAKRMELVYSGAHCVLAVSRAGSHYAGFLSPLKRRDCVTVAGRQKDRSGTSAPFYLCENIDDFDSHVLKSALSSRGWVLQEHALARRTIFFTEHQTYWECGEGVRCETMMRMKNDLAAFLGDPRFPKIIMDVKQGEKITHYQNLYKQYSRLSLTNAFDRPMAINGLQDRILSALGTKGGFGVFDEGKEMGLLRRSLLWYRSDKTPRLDRITFPPDRAISVVPSWSWMAYTGGIDYISPTFGGTSWEALQSPWSTTFAGSLPAEVQRSKIALVAEAREFSFPTARERAGECLLQFDTPGQSEQQVTTPCVVLGRQKPLHGAQGIPTMLGQANDKDHLVHYLLLVRPTSKADRKGSTIYERVGAGYLPGRYILASGPGTITIH